MRAGLKLQTEQEAVQEERGLSAAQPHQGLCGAGTRRGELLEEGTHVSEGRLCRLRLGPQCSQPGQQLARSHRLQVVAGVEEHGAGLWRSLTPQVGLKPDVGVMLALLVHVIDAAEAGPLQQPPAGGAEDVELVAGDLGERQRDGRYLVRTVSRGGTAGGLHVRTHLALWRLAVAFGPAPPVPKLLESKPLMRKLGEDAPMGEAKVRALDDEP